MLSVAKRPGVRSFTPPDTSANGGWNYTSHRALEFMGGMGRSSVFTLFSGFVAGAQGDRTGERRCLWRLTVLGGENLYYFSRIFIQFCSLFSLVLFFWYCTFSLIVHLVHAWKDRGKLPLSIEITANLQEICLLDSERHGHFDIIQTCISHLHRAQTGSIVSDSALALLYAMTISRSVLHVLNSLFVFL